MAVHFFTEDTRMPAFSKMQVKKWIKDVAASYGKSPADINYIFCTDAKILEINRQYLQHDYYTDIITFDYSDNHEIAGDLFISLDTVSSNAEKFGADCRDELLRVMIHGVLHLCGLNDKNQTDEQHMRHAENMALEMLKNS